MKLNPPHSHKVQDLARNGLSACGEAILINCMLSQWSGKSGNREMLIDRIRGNTPEIRKAAVAVYDEFCKAKGV